MTSGGRPWRWWRLAALFLLVPPSLLAAWLLLIHNTDQALLPQARAILDGPAAPVPPSANLYFTGLGMGADGGDDLNTEGQRVFALYQKNQATVTDIGTLVNIYKTAGVGQIDLAGDEKSLGCLMFRDKDAHHCIADVPQQREAWTELVRNNRRLLDRYRTLWSWTQYRDPTEMARVPPVNPLVERPFLRRLFFTAMALQVDRNELDAALGDIEADTVFWRRLLAQRDLGLVDKMVFLTRVRADLEFISEILRTRTLTPVQLDALAAVLKPSDQAERSLAGVWESQLRVIDSTLAEWRPKSFDAAWHSAPGIDDRRDNLLIYLLYRRNAHNNFEYRFFQSLSELDNLPCGEIATKYQALRETSDFSLAGLLNDPLRYVMGSHQSAGFREYPQRICDVLGMRRIVDAQLLIRRKQLADADIPGLLANAGADYSDPYTGQPLRWDPQTHTLSFEVHDQSMQGLVPWPI